MPATRSLKLIVWAYFFLLIFEGAIRRWILPGLATPLLIVRDPLVVAGLWVAYREGQLPFNRYFLICLSLGIITVFTALLFGHGNLTVALFGWRTNYLHLPFVFVIAAAFDRADVQRLGRVVLLLSAPMTLLMAVQFYSPQSAWVNIGLGGEESAGFQGALGYLRPPGTFSFITGPASFFPLVTAFVLTALLQPHTGRTKFLAVVAAVATLAVIPISISRTLMLSVSIVILGVVPGLYFGGRSLRGLINVGLFGCILLLIVSLIPSLDTPREAFLARWNESTTDNGGVKGALLDRVLQGLTGGVSLDQPHLLTGFGLGMGTNAGAKLLSGSTAYLVSETEWGRVTGEIGLPLGLIFILARVALTAQLFLIGIRTARQGDLLPLLLACGAFPLVFMGQWSPPNILGFSTLFAGLVLAAAKTQPNEILRPPSPEAASNPIPPRNLALSGRFKNRQHLSS
jgi:hypothetical protein